MDLNVFTTLEIMTAADPFPGVITRVLDCKYPW